MRVLLLGGTGQLGWELQRALAPLGQVVVLGRRGRAGPGADLSRPEELARTVREAQADVIVNAAAYTAVDRAESEPDLARAVNARAPGILAEIARETGAWLVHYSTDYVFDGSGKDPWRESDSVGPLSVYGATKLEGEAAIREAGCRYLIFRTSWVYAARGGNFVRTLLRLACERDRLTIVDDQVGAPTGADLLAETTAHAIRVALARPDVAGLYHLTATGETSWYDYARFVIDRARSAGTKLRVAPDGIVPVTTGAFPTPARRPLNSRLDTGRFREVFQLHLAPWQAGVARLLTEILDSRP